MNVSDLINKELNLPPRILLYTVPGWGKSTFASMAPSPIFVDMEDGLMGLDVDSFPVSRTLGDFKKWLSVILEADHDYKTLVIDSISSLEPLIWQDVVDNYEKKVNSIGSIGYYQGYDIAKDEWIKILKFIEKIRSARKMTILFLGHARTKSISNPMHDPYNKYVLTIQDKAADVLKREVDFILFGANQMTVKQEDNEMIKKRAVGNSSRIILTEDRPAFDAKHRWDMPFEVNISKENGWNDFYSSIKKENKNE